MPIKRFAYQQRALIIAGFLSLTGVWFCDVFLTDGVFCHADLARYFYPLRHYGASMMRSGEIPLWNPYILCGTPFLAVLQTVVFYPLSVIYYGISDFPLAFNLFVGVHIFLAALFMYALMRHWRHSAFSSVLSAVTFAYGGYLMSVIVMNTSLSSAIWLPLILLYYDRSLARISIRSMSAVSLFMAIQFSGGNPDFIFMTCIILALYTAYAVICRQSDRPRRRLIGRAAFVFIAVNLLWIGLSLCQFLPFWELLLHSARSAGSRYATITRWSVSPLELIGFVIPFIKGNISVSLGHLDPQKWLISYYVGIVPFIFSLIAVMFRRRRIAMFFTLLLLFSLVLSLGKYTPVFNIFYQFVPGFSYVRYPVKYLFIGFFSLSVLAGIGFDTARALSPEEKKCFARTLLAACFVMAVIVMILNSYWDELRDYFVGTFMPAEGTIEERLEKVLYTFLSDGMYVIHAFLILSAFTVIWVARVAGAMSHSLFLVLTMLTAVTDLWSVNAGFVKYAHRSVMNSKLPSLTLLKEDGTLYRIAQGKTLWEINKKIYGFNYNKGIRDRIGTLMSNCNMLYGVSDVYGYDSLVRRDIVAFMTTIRELPDPQMMRLLGMMNVKYIFSVEDLPGDVVFKGPLAGGRIAYSDGRLLDDFSIIRNPYYLNRVNLYRKMVFVPRDEDALEMLTHKEFDPSRELVITDQRSAEIRTETLARHGGAGAGEYARVNKYAPHEVIIEANADGRRYLLLADSFYPGWKATVDGRPVKIRKANYLLRAIEIAEGRHQIRFFYAPETFRYGMFGSIATAMILLTLCLVRYCGSAKGAFPHA